MRASDTTLPGVVEAGGVVRGRVTATIASRVQAPVVEVRVAPGDRVRQGQLLVVLDDRDVAASVRQAGARDRAAERSLEAARAERTASDAALTLARATHDRLAVLHERKSATAQEYDEAVAALKAAEARAATAAARVEEATAAVEGARAGDDLAAVTASYARVTAPFDAVVTEKLVDPGNLVSPGTPLLVLEDARESVLEIRLDESRAASVRVGDTVPVVLDVGGGLQATDARVAELARAIDADARAVLVKLALPAALTVRPGTFGRARFAAASRRGLTVPASAVLRRGQLTQVFVVEGGRARLRLISIGIAAPTGAVDVLAGLVAGDLVIVDPPPTLRDGAPVSGEGIAVPAASASGGRR